MTTDTAAEEAPMTTTRTFRTFELFDIRWDRGSTWTAYDTAEEAQAIIDSSVARGSDGGTVVRRTWEVEIEDWNRDRLRPGCGDRVEVVA